VNGLSPQKINTGNYGKTKLCTLDDTTNRILKMYAKLNDHTAVLDAVEAVCLPGSADSRVSWPLGLGLESSDGGQALGLGWEGRAWSGRRPGASVSGPHHPGTASFSA
jgi:hypothetical protein